MHINLCLGTVAFLAQVLLGVLSSLSFSFPTGFLYGMASAAVRNRALANKMVPSTVYEEIIHKWLSDPPAVAVHVKVGPLFVNDIRQVSPACLQSLSTILHGFLDAGCNNGVVQSNKLRDAIMKE